MSATRNPSLGFGVFLCLLALDTIDPAWAWQPFEPTDAASGIERLAAHLFRRAAFGATVAQLDAAVKQSPAASSSSRLCRDRRTRATFASNADELARPFCRRAIPGSSPHGGCT